MHDLQSGVTGHFDADGRWPHAQVRHPDGPRTACVSWLVPRQPRPLPSSQLLQLKEQFVYTYGFSFLYRRDLFPTFSFADTSWGEDQEILKRVRASGRKLTMHRDLAGICLHNQHGENCSRSFAQVCHRRVCKCTYARVRRAAARASHGGRALVASSRCSQGSCHAAPPHSQVAVKQRAMRASPLGHMLDSLPVIASALAGRACPTDSGEYGGLVVRSQVTGGLFIWESQLPHHGNDVSTTLQAFTDWLWSGNGFSKERYQKLGLQRPELPSEMKERARRVGGANGGRDGASLVEGAGQGLETLRAHEGLATAHLPGASLPLRCRLTPAPPQGTPTREHRRRVSERGSARRRRNHQSAGVRGPHSQGRREARSSQQQAHGQLGAEIC